MVSAYCRHTAAMVASGNREIPMSQTIYLEPSQVPATLRAGYNGKAFRAEICETVTIPADAGLWDSGSRETYSMLRIADGASVPFPGQQSAPWAAGRADRTVTLQPGFAVVMR